MEAFWNAIKSLKRWQMVALLLVILGAASATYGVYTRVSASGQVELAENQQLIPVGSGNLTNQVSTSGNLVFPERESLTFGSAGTVLEVLVTAGQQVTKGQALARLDLAAVASAEEAVAQSRLDLQNAQQSLAALDVDYALLQAQAEESVANAEFQLHEAREVLEDARQPHTEEAIRTQQETVASARLTLQDAQEALANLEPDYALRLAQARQAKVDAETALKDARDALTDLESNHNLELATAVQAKADAEAALKQAEEALADYEAANGQWLGAYAWKKPKQRPAWRKPRALLTGWSWRKNRFLATLLIPSGSGSNS
jgi:tetratricopeptide (TPR) repeat protein